MTFHIITLFPHAFDSYLGESILKRAIEDKKIRVKFYNPRDYARPNRGKRGFRAGAIRIDKKPYGGGPGMVIQAEPVIKAVEAAILSSLRKQGTRKAKLDSRLRENDKRGAKVSIIWLTPSGKQFTNESGVKYARHTDLIIICGRYEGIDARVRKVFSARGGSAYGGKVEEISVGPYVLTGGELPAMIMIDVIARQVEGVLGDFNSREESRIASPDVYTRPEVFEYRGQKYRVPKILLSGHRANIDEWRQKRKKR